MINVSTEVGALRRLIIHSPDSGLGKVIPSKAQDWLFEDIVHIDTLRRTEYDYYVKILLYFMDPDKVRGKIAEIDNPENDRAFYKPGNPDYFNSSEVLDIQQLLIEVLQKDKIRHEVIASIAALERCSMQQRNLLHELDPVRLSHTLISGSLPDGRMIFSPVPNFIFTRDIGIVINDHLLLNKPAKEARRRESFLSQYVFYYHEAFADMRERILEIRDDEHFFLLEDAERNRRSVTLEGGDIMMSAPDNLVVGVSERTTPRAVDKIIHSLFDKGVVKKVSVVKIPPKRDFMHIDTVFTQVKRDLWVLYGRFSKHNRPEEGFSRLYKEDATNRVEILQYEDGRWNPNEFDHLEDLLDDISRNDMNSGTKTDFIYSGGDKFPYSLREQWTDSCNVLALKEGIVIGYDRNDKTAESFAERGFRVIGAAELIDKFESGELSPETLTDTLIMLPSAELSRARGGSHCMSMPLFRDPLV